ncbi:hypothetical protein COY07_06455 [Candidatus Peregrinibacteria bacterium CG_4_10_14_0_2_um_filter_43_11]|nr:MAG: hypothetical protein COY07_06455 [Candidatus Peregrinibacteria bacterium CG_4_10_14_0_2_um_filter_43_11]
MIFLEKNMTKHFRTHHYVLLGLMTAVMMTLGTTMFFNQSVDGLTAAANEKEILSIMHKRYNLEDPDIAMNKNGDIVIVWQEKRGKDYDVYAVKTHASHNVLERPFQVNTYSVNSQKQPQITMNENGDFTVIWESFGQDGSGSGIYGQQFTDKGEKSGSEFLINTTREHNQNEANISMNNAGEFVVTWLSDLKLRGTRGVFLQKFNATGNLVGKETRVDTNEYKVKDDYAGLSKPNVAITNEKKVMVAWQMMNNETWNIYKRNFDWEGNILDKEQIAVPAKQEGNQMNPAIMAFNETQFFVVWEKDLQWTQYKDLDLKKESIQGQIFDNKGNKILSPIDVKKGDFDSHNEPRPMATTEGAMVIWQSRTKAEKENADEQYRKNMWAIMFQKVKTNATLVGDTEQLDTNEDQPYSRTRVASNQRDIVGIIWKGKYPKKTQSIINFRRLTIEKTPDIIVNPLSILNKKKN